MSKENEDKREKGFKLSDWIWMSTATLWLLWIVSVLGFGIIIYSMVDDLMPNRITKK